MSNPYRQLPAVEQLLRQLPSEDYNHERLVAVCREVLDTARQQIAIDGVTPTEQSLLDEVNTRLALEHVLSLRQVINATGVIIHTNLGRAPLSDAAVVAMQAVAGDYSTLEYDLQTGQRGHRDSHIESLITDVTGAEAALIVNNNAAAIYLTLSALAKDREVVISRSELVEIGGGFRIPEMMQQSGAILHEIGTTNRTRVNDFEQAITENTAAFLRVHWSNFKVIGYTQHVAMAEMVILAHQHQLLVFDDLGSGALLDTAQFGLEHEPTVQESIAAGADLVMFSGDKLLGGPQAGIIVGQQALVEQLRKFPLTRALRPDKLCLAALSATLRHYRDDDPLATVPVWQMISARLPQLEHRVTMYQSALGGEIIDGESTVGGGSLPGNTLPSLVLSLPVSDIDDAASKLRQQSPPVIARIQNDALIFDPRTVLNDDLFIRTTKQAIQ
jgi:L-seryl-tRNA(Ser) seleniumtransferase